MLCGDDARTGDSGPPGDFCECKQLDINIVQVHINPQMLDVCHDQHHTWEVQEE